MRDWYRVEIKSIQNTAITAIDNSDTRDMHNNKNWDSRLTLQPLALILLVATLWFVDSLSPALSQATVPNSARNEQTGTLLAGPVDPQMGRLANIQFLGGHIITIPETPGSEPSDHQRTQAWDISNPLAPRKIAPTNPDGNFGDFGRTGNPILAHGTYSRGNEVFVAGNNDNANRDFDTVRLNNDGSLSHVRWSGPTAPELFNRVAGQPGVPGPAFNPRRFANWTSKGAMMQPWAINDSWSYNSPNPLATLTLRNILMAEWNITAETGASGFGNFFGNLLIYVSDQLRGGVAIYDATDIQVGADGVSRPRLLDTFNTPRSEGGVGGYWSEISGHYIVIGRETVGSDPNSFNGVQVINFEDPSDIKLQCQTELINPNADQSFALQSRPRYPGLQDEFVFADNFKVNIETCEVETVADISNGQTTNNLCQFPATNCPRRIIDTGEYNRVIGNLVVSGGFPTQPNIDGMSIWVHQQAADTRAPFIAHQIPQANQSNYPVNAPLSFSIPETLRSETIITSENRRAGQTDSITITEVDNNGDLLSNGLVATDYVLSHQGILTLNPVNLLNANTTYEVSFTNAIQDAVGNRLQATSFRFSTGNSVNGGGNSTPNPAVISRVDVSPSNNIEVGGNVTVSVVSPNAISYQIALEGESAAFSNQASRRFNFDSSGTFAINVRARNDDGDSSLQRVLIEVREPGIAAAPGRNSSQLSCDAENNSVWAVNPDNNTVTVLNANNLATRAELSVPNNPQSAALVNSPGNGDEIWVSAKGDDRIVIFDADTRARKRTIDTGYGSGPSHILAGNTGEFVYVSFFNSGQVARYSTSNINNSPDTIDLAPTANAMALTPDGNRLLITRLISPENWGEVFAVDTQNWQLQQTFRLDKHLVDDSLNEGRGKPNYLTSIVVNGLGNRAYLVGKKDNIDRGALNAGTDLDPDNTVRTISMVLDLENNIELKNQRQDFDNTSSLSALSISADSQTLFIAEQGRNAVRAIPVDSNLIQNGQTRVFATGLAPQGLCFDGQRNKLFTKNFTDRTVTAVDLSSGLASASLQNTSTVASETLNASELSGLQLFYNAFEGLTASSPVGRISAEGYISCASCHLDGGEDGNTWDFTGRGEGLRNNISLRGRSGLRFGNVHWSANFDEIQDFEHDIRDAFGGRGFLNGSQFSATSPPLGAPKAGLSQALDDLAAYVSSLGRQSLPRSNSRSSNGDIMSNAQSGRAAFSSQGCTDCHSGTAFTDRQRHDVGTLRASSGQRSGQPLTGIKTPSLLGVFDTAPYLHDGSAKTINDVFNTVGGDIWELDLSVTDTNFEFNGEPIVQTNYSYLRSGLGVRLNGNGALAGRFAQFTDGVSGQAKIRVRYGSAISGGQLEILINEVLQGTINLQTLPQVDGQDALFTESPSLDFTVPDNEFGFVITLRYRGDSSVIIDEFTVSNAQDIAKAEPHTRVASISTQIKNSLIRYVRSIDRRSAPADSDTDIFDSPRPPPPPTPTPGSEAAELCFPIKVRDQMRYAIICI